MESRLGTGIEPGRGASRNGSPLLCSTAGPPGVSAWEDLEETFFRRDGFLVSAGARIPFSHREKGKCGAPERITGRFSHRKRRNTENLVEPECVCEWRKMEKRTAFAPETAVSQRRPGRRTRIPGGTPFQAQRKRLFENLFSKFAKNSPWRDFSRLVQRPPMASAG